MFLSAMIQSSAVAAVISDPRLPDNPIVDCNQAFVDLTGYSRDEIIGRNCRFLSGEGTEPGLTESLRVAIRDERPIMVEILNYKKDGAPIFGDSGALEYFLGSQVEVPDDVASASELRRKQAAERIASLTPRQRDIVVHLAAGKLNKQIGFDLGICERTVKMHRSAVLRSLGLRTTADIIRLAIEAGY
jgi:PAS domain S-box-containing protein